jgi:macrolide transport system ATP-binding/permease protein
METLLLDVRYALRVFRANPALFATAVLSLAIGIGPNSVLFSVIDAVGFRPLPIRDPDGLVIVRSTNVKGPESDSLDTKGVAFIDYVEVRDRLSSFSEVGASGMAGFGLSGGTGPAEFVMGATATASYFTTLGVRVLRGRTFLPEEDRTAGSQPVIVISERLWRRRFGSDAAAIGTSVRVNSTSCTIVGVLPTEFAGTNPILAPDIWVPTMLWPTLSGGPASTLEAKASRAFTVVARLRDGVTLAQAGGEVAALGASLAERDPETHKDWRLVAEYEQAARRHRLGRIGTVSLVAVDLILLLACANVAGLLLGRAEARRPEVAVRVALGASRWRLVRQLLTESALLSVAGAATGALLAFWLLRLVPSLIPAMPITFNLDFRLDLRVLAGTLAVALVAAPVFGLFPALLASRPDVVPLLKGAAPGAARRRWRITPRNVLVVGQIAVSMALLVSSALLTRSFLNQQRIDPGFVPRPMVFSTMAPGAVGYDRVRTREFYRQLLERLAATPGVERATMVRHLPLNSLFGGGATAEVAIPGYEPPPEAGPLRLRFNVVETGYFETMGIRLVRGRDFLATDGPGAHAVVLINQTMARRFWPGADPIGRHVMIATGNDAASRRDCEIVGVVQDGKYLSLNEPPEPYLYLPSAQQPLGEMTVVARVSTDARAMSKVFRREVARLDAAMPIMQVTTMDQHMQSALVLQRAVAAMVGALGGFGLLLSVIGLYGVVAFLVSRRTREIGIRIALGARRADVVRDVVAQGGRLAALGIVVGLGLAVAVMSGLGHDAVYGLSRFDPVTYAATSAVVLLTALAGCYVPARLASRVDPIAALRSE